jgi:hypothetical protein
LLKPGDDDQAAAVGPAEIAVDLHAQGDGTEVVVAHGRGPAHGCLHAPGGFALLLADLGGVDRLPPAGQVQGRRQQPDRDGQGELRPQERSRHGQMHNRGAELPQPTHVAGEVVSQGWPRPTLDRDHRADGGRGGEGELPPAHARHSEECLAGGPRE